MRHRSRVGGPTFPVAVFVGVTLLALLAPEAGAGTSSGAGSRSQFCRTARAVQDSYERIDETDPDESVEDLQEAEAAYRALADEAPAQLRTAFRRILAFFPTLEDAASGKLDIDDRTEGARYVRAAKKAGPAFDRVRAALDDRCGIEIDWAWRDADAPRRRFFRRLDRIVTALERDAPRSLRKTFRTLRPVYDAIAENQENLGLLVSEPKARRALNQLARYGRRNCGLDLPSF